MDDVLRPDRGRDRARPPRSEGARRRSRRDGRSGHAARPEHVPAECERRRDARVHARKRPRHRAGHQIGWHTRGPRSPEGRRARGRRGTQGRTTARPALTEDQLAGQGAKPGPTSGHENRLPSAVTQRPPTYPTSPGPNWVIKVPGPQIAEGVSRWNGPWSGRVFGATTDP